MRKNNVSTITIFVLLFLVTIAGFFLLDIEQTKINICALIFLIFSYMVNFCTTLFVTTPTNHQDKVFSISGINSLNIFYQLIVIISILCIKFFEIKLGVFLFTQLVITAIYLAIFISIIQVSESIRSKNKKIQEKLDHGEYDTPKRGGF